MGKERMIFIAGPTASGKSAAALDLAAKIGGEIVNVCTEPHAIVVRSRKASVRIAIGTGYCVFNDQS